MIYDTTLCNVGDTLYPFTSGTAQPRLGIPRGTFHPQFEDLSCVELFAGVKTVARGFQCKAYSTTEF